MCFVWATTRKKNPWISVLISLKYFYLFIENIYCFVQCCWFVCFPTWNAFSLHMAAQIKRLWAYICIFIMNYNNSIIKRLIYVLFSTKILCKFVFVHAFLCTNFMQVKPTNCFRNEFLKLWKFKNWLSELFFFCSCGFWYFYVISSMMNHYTIFQQ